MQPTKKNTAVSNHAVYTFSRRRRMNCACQLGCEGVPESVPRESSHLRDACERLLDDLTDTFTRHVITLRHLFERQLPGYQRGQDAWQPSDRLATEATRQRLLSPEHLAPPGATVPSLPRMCLHADGADLEQCHGDELSLPPPWGCDQLFISSSSDTTPRWIKRKICPVSASV